MIDLETVQEQVTNFLTDTADARQLSEKCRDYFDHKQWTDQELKVLKQRRQAALTVNRVRPKIRGLVGLYNLRKTDPKAYPRTQKHEKSAHAITDALRFVADNTDFASTRLDVAEEFFVEGYAGVIVDVRKKPNEVEINIGHIPWDRIYFDSHSRKRDYSDARYMGIVLWMDTDEAREKFPDADIDTIMGSANQQDAVGEDETFEDRPKWVDKRRDRIRVALHFCMHKGKWYMSIFSADFLVKPQVSPFLDDEGQPCNPIELVSANVDRDNNRYGEALTFLDQQDEINHRRSKFLFQISQRQTHGRKGAVKDVPALKREMAKPDGHVEWDGHEFGKDFGLLETNDMSQGQFLLYQDGKAELDAVSVNAQLAGERQQGDLSGVAIQKLQQAGTIELNQQYALLAGWEKRVYRQVWARVKQFWTEEKWIRVTDDQDSLRWVGLNAPVPAGQFLQETAQDESVPQQQRMSAAAALQYLSQTNPQALQQPVDVQNPVAELDVDIIIDQSFDVINVQQEQFEMLAKFAQGSDVDIVDLIELSEIRNKEDLIEKIEKRRAQAAQASQGATQLLAAKEQAGIQKTQADTALVQQKVVGEGIENVLRTLGASVVPKTSVTA